MSKKDIVNYIIEEYGVTSSTDITNALKDLLGETFTKLFTVQKNQSIVYKRIKST